MKLSQLRNLIREEAKSALNEGIVENIHDEIGKLMDKHRKLKGTLCYVVINGAEGNIYGVYKNKELAEEAKKIASYNLAMRGSNYSAYIEESKLYDELG
jgi:hypothetical protein